MSRLSRPVATLFILTASLAAIGCPNHAAGPSIENRLSPGNGADAQPLTKRIDDVLTFTLEGRSLSLEEHAAWQILHGALAFQARFPVEKNGESVSAVKHILDGGSMKGWTVEVVRDPASDRKGLRAILEEGSKAGQGHADQWLAVLSQCGLPADEPIKVNDDSLTMMDFVRQVQQDVPRNVKQEFSWTLIGLTSYLPTSTRWKASDDQEWSIERLVEIETQQELSSSACGGTHRVIGLAMTLNRHRESGGEMTDVWNQADTVIKQAVEDARRHQNPDGSFSTHYFSRPGSSPDLAQNLGATGHIVEFLAIALDDEQIQEPWVRRSVEYLCGVFEKTRTIPLECGGLYHAAHGLVLMRERLGDK